MVAIFLFAKDIEVSVSELEAQSAINAFLWKEHPLLTAHQPQGSSIITTLENISIDFKANNTAQVQSVILWQGDGYSHRFEVKFSAGIDYRMPNLYFDKLEFIEYKEIAIEHESNKSKKGIPNSGSNLLVEKFLILFTKKDFESIPVYDLRKSLKKDMLANRPLKDVRFTETNAIITLSPITALIRKLLTISMIFLTIAWVLTLILPAWLVSKTSSRD